MALIAPLTQAQEDVPKPFQGLVINSPVMRKIIAWTLAIPMSIRNAPKLLKFVFGPDAVPADFPTRGGGCWACGRTVSTTPPQLDFADFKPRNKALR